MMRRLMRRRRLIAAVTALTALSGGASGTITSAAGELTFTHALVLSEDGSLTEGLAVVVKDGRIARVVEDSASDLPNVVKLPDGSVLSPGLIDLASSAGTHGNRESAYPIDPGTSARAVVDRMHRELRVAGAAGVTAVMICPEPANIVSGTCVTLRTVQQRRKQAQDGVERAALRDDAALVFSVSDRVLRRDREPTSRAGLARLLRAALSGEAATHARLKAYRAGRLPGLVFCGTAADVRIATDAFDAIRPRQPGSEPGRFPTFFYSPDAPLPEVELFASLAAKRNAMVVLGPFDFDSSERSLRAAGVLARAGVRVAFRGSFPAASRHSLRVSAALAVGAGMNPRAARRALTINAAVVAGVGHLAGSIAAGRAADLVLFSGDPLRLDSQVLRVYVGGQRLRARRSTRWQ